MKVHRSLTVAVALAVLVAGCGTPGGDSKDNEEQAKEATKNSKKVDVAAAGNVTLTIWDQEVRGGQAKQIKQLNRAFQEQYPNVKIKRVARSFSDLNRTLKLAVSGEDAPDIVQANQGRPIMGQLVKGSLLKPMDTYADAYGWADRWSKTLLDLNRFSTDGKAFGSGSLYGVSQMGEIVGVFYNKEKVGEFPQTFADFEAKLAEAKQAGDIPIAFGNLDKWPGIHEFQAVQNRYSDRQATRDFVFAAEGASFETPENVEAATKIQEWADQDYFTPDFNGTGYDPAWQEFAKGKAWFTIAGTWITADLADSMGDEVGFALMPGAEAGAPPVSLGGESLPWAITQKSKNADVAAAYIDFITNAKAASVLTETNNLPAMTTDAQPTEPLTRDVFAAWKALNDADGIVPYLDYATPTFYDEISGGVQELLADQATPEAFTKDIESGYAEFTESLQP